MTSKNSFFKSMKQDLEQRIWLPVVFFILGFLALEIMLITRLDNMSDLVNYNARATVYLMNTFFSPLSHFSVVTVGMAAVSALSGFMYMHSAKKLDVYHSIPIRREKLFIRQFVYGILYYLAPMVVHVLICLAVCAANGLLEGRVLVQAAGFVLVQLLIYLACYSCVVTAVVLTGNLVISVLGSGILLSYSLILGVLKGNLMLQFLKTFCMKTSWGMDFPAFSPIHLIGKLVYTMRESEGECLVYTDYLGFYGKLLIMVVIYALLALFLYRKRPTEAAGQSMVFPVTEPVIKTMVVVPAAFVVGNLFYSLSAGSNQIPWFVFGSIFGFVIACPLMEMIFRKDVRAALMHPLQLAFNGVCVIGVFAVLYFDVFGYDSYIPAEDEVESYAVYFNAMPHISGEHGSSESYCMEHMAITDNESTRKLLEHGAGITRAVYASEQEGEIDTAKLQEGYCSLLVKYQLKNGRSVYRRYLVNIASEEVLQWVGDTCDSLEYRLGTYPILSESTEKNYSSIDTQYAYGEETLRLPAEDMQQFVDTYQRELMNLKFEELLQEYPIAELCFITEVDASDMVDASDTVQASVARIYKGSNTASDYTLSSGYLIYPSFTGTLALLEEYGGTIADKLALEDVVSMEVVDSSLEKDDHDGLMTKLITLEYNREDGQQEEIEQILSGVVTGIQKKFPFWSGRDIEQDISVEITYATGKIQEKVKCSFKKGEIPDFVKEAIAAEKVKLLQQ